MNRKFKVVAVQQRA